MEVHELDRKQLVKKAGISNGSVHNALTNQPMYKSTLGKIAEALYTTLEAITIYQPVTILNSEPALVRDQSNIQTLTLFSNPIEIDDQDKEILRQAAQIINKLLNETTA